MSILNMDMLKADAAEDEAPLLSFEPSILHCSKLATMSIEPRPFVLTPFWREGDLGFIHGPRGLGKTWLSLTLAKASSSGTSPVPWFECPSATPVLYVDGEMTLDAIRTRMLSLGAEDGPLYVLSHEQHFSATEGILNLTDTQQQQAITTLCLTKGIKVLFLDNLSCLFSGVKENDADSWELVLPWLLSLRRHGISVVVVAHSGRNGEMRGTSRREDAAAWVLRLDESHSHTTPGAKFLASFTKNRHATEDKCPPLDWSFQTGTDGKVSIGCRLLDEMEQLRLVIGDGQTRCSDIAEITGWSKSKVSRVARKAVAAGWLAMDGRNYQLK